MNSLKICKTLAEARQIIVQAWKGHCLGK